MALKRGWVTYTTDDGQNLSIKAGIACAAFNGQTLQPFPTVGSAWPYGKRDLRHVYGANAAFGRSKMTVLDEATYDPLIIGTDGFNDTAGHTFTITSKIGERKNARDAR